MVRKMNNTTGFDGLLSAHTQALQENSKEILEILKVLKDSKQQLSYSEKRSLMSIEKQLASLDKSIDSTIEED